MLVEVATRLTAIVDSASLVARLGGDEFAVLLLDTHGSDPERAERFSRAIIESLSDPFVLGDVEIYASASIGVISLNGYASADDLLRDADTAMYSAKRDRTAIRYFEPKMHVEVHSQRQLISDLRRASEAREFHLVYQPVVDAATQRVVSLEALLRWSPERALSPISPGLFLPALERTGLIVDVGAWVIAEACRQLAAWRVVHGLDDVTIAINLSRSQLHHRGLVDHISRCLHRFGLRGEDIVFEITETSIATDTGPLVGTLEELRGLGARIAIDDFGVGQSCLAQLLDIPVDVMKIDMSFVRRIRTGAAHDDPVLEAILALGASLDKDTVAEGVETPDQAAWLASRGCDQLQGYFFDRPLSPVAVSERITDGVMTASGWTGPLPDARGASSPSDASDVDAATPR